VSLVNRLVGAHLNGLEAFPAWAVAVLLCKVNKVKGADLRPLAIRFLQLRLLYNMLYMLGVHQVVAAARTLVWLSGLATTFEAFGLALAA